MIIFPKITVNKFADKLYFQSQILYFSNINTVFVYNYSIDKPKKVI